MKDVVQNEVSEEETTTETTAEEVPEEKVEKLPKEVEEKKEVIKLETLNSAPTLKETEPVWKRLSGKELLDWAAKNPHYQI